MAEKSNIPTFKIAKPEKVQSAIGRLRVPRTTPDKLAGVINELLASAAKGGVRPKVIKGSLTLY